jgi:hypothetical protein
MIPPSPCTERLLTRVFAAEDREVVRQLLTERCAETLPFQDNADPISLERIRLAVMRLSEGDPEKLRVRIREAQIDWRDVLVAAGFGEEERAHDRWEP